MAARPTRRPRTLSLVGAAIGSGSLLMLAAAPGMAAAPVAQATATGLVLTVASTPTDSGSYQVTNDGTAQTSTGNSKPAISALGGQSFISAGTLAQDAVTKVTNGRGSSAACAGLAGDGATLAAAGEGSCLTPGDNLKLNAGTFSIDDLTVVGGTATAGIGDTLSPVLQPVLDQLAPTIDTAVQTALSSIGNPDLTLDLGAIQSTCTAGPGTKTTGDADLADVSFDASIMGMNLSLLKLPAHPAPNTKVVTNLSAVVDAIQTALDSQLDQSLMGTLAPLGTVSDTVLDAIKQNVLDAVAPQLAPLEDNVLSGTLNVQKIGTGKIAVTALDLNVLPAAQAAGVTLVSADIGKSTCGPSGRVRVTEPQRPPTKNPTKVPTVVPSGLADGDSGQGSPEGGLLAGGALALLGALAAAAGVRSYRRGA